MSVSIQETVHMTEVNLYVKLQINAIISVQESCLTERKKDVH